MAGAAGHHVPDHRAHRGDRGFGGRDALVLTVWQPFDVGFVPAAGLRLDAAQIEDVHTAAEQTAAEGVSLAEAAGFGARSVTIEAAPTWKAIVLLQ